MQIEEKIVKAISLLNENGFKAYLVGGFVRDMIMGKKSHDVDITSDAKPEEVITVFSAYKVILTGIKHATVTVLFEGLPLEITTFRLESSYSDGRHPDKVEFSSSLIEDLKRRDLTINAIAFHPQEGIIDPFGGCQDIQNKIIRCVGDANQRFQEDALRILRTLRFCSTLGFDIEKKTSLALKKNAELLKNISKERIFSEFSKLICGSNARFILINYFNNITIFLPFFELLENFNQFNPHHEHDLLTHTAIVVENSPDVIHLRLAALLHDIAKPKCFSLDENSIGHFYSHASLGSKMADEILQDLKCDNITRQKVIKLIKLHDTPIEANEVYIKKRLNRIGEEMFFDLIALQRADNLGLAKQYHTRQKTYDEIVAIAKNVIKQKQCFSLKDLDINGHNLIELDIYCEDIGKTLNLILNKVIEGSLLNNKNDIIDFVKSIKR